MAKQARSKVAKKEVVEPQKPVVKPMRFVDQYPEAPGCCAIAHCVFGRFAVVHENWEFFEHGSNTAKEAGTAENFRLAALDAPRRYKEMVLELLDLHTRETET